MGQDNKSPVLFYSRIERKSTRNLILPRDIHVLQYFHIFDTMAELCFNWRCHSVKVSCTDEANPLHIKRIIIMEV